MPPEVSMASSDKFAPGDIVVLKSGGPKMTIDSECSNGGYWTVWFAGVKRERAHFHEEAITTPPSEPLKK
jgi:uncharacterized protein YodC (DUF2158 family)